MPCFNSATRSRGLAPVHRLVGTMLPLLTTAVEVPQSLLLPAACCYSSAYNFGELQKSWTLVFPSLQSQTAKVFNMFVVLDFRSSHFSSSSSVIKPCSAIRLVSLSNPGIHFHYASISCTRALRIFVVLDFILFGNYSRPLLRLIIKLSFGFR